VPGCHPSDSAVIHTAYALLMDEERRHKWGQQRLAPPPYGSSDYGTGSAEPQPCLPPPIHGQNAPHHRDERTPLFPSHPQGNLPRLRRRTAACGQALTAAAAHGLASVVAVFVLAITAAALVLQFLAVAFIRVSSFAIPVFALFGIIWLIAIGLMGLANALGRVHWPQLPPPYQRNIAIVGAGPAGVTTAYQLSQLCSQQGIPVQITIYEQSSHIGGRAVHSIVLPSGDSLELGAGTFPKTARLLTSAAYTLGLETQVFSNGAADLTGPSGSGSFGVFVPHDVRAIEQLTNTFYLATTAAPGPSLNRSHTTSSTTIAGFRLAGGGRPRVSSATSSRMLGNDFPTCTMPSPTLRISSPLRA